MCGVAAAPWADEVYVLLEGLQHRGQESAGVAWVEDGEIKFSGGMGLVKDAIKEAPHKGPAIGHVRYSTSGGYARVQPVVTKKLALAFNGNIINFKFLEPSSRWDAEALIKSIINEKTKGLDLFEAARRVLERAKGSYSLVALAADGRVLVARDPWGFRPLAYRWPHVASETAALEDIGMTWEELEPNKLVMLEEGVPTKEAKISYDRRKAYCAFEYVYFQRPESYFNGVNVHVSRVRMGMILAEEKPADADVVLPVPDSGRSAAIGYSRRSGIPLDEGLVKNRYLGRSFIMPPGLREVIAMKKYGVVKEVVEGKRVVVVDDSIVRGTTMKRIVKLLKEKGAEEVHVRIASPPVRAPCYMGIDFPSREELVAAERGEEELSELWGADSVGYLSVEGLRRAIGLEELCVACFTDVYPFPISEEEVRSMLKAHKA
ncbi:amidophosphoribosyltransferase [Ignicoccus hospitalis KIN4/I]|uniref:Amidophosphoribosyltransferase n=1 Tax=Ignicoccus hospitalis (strain KIN4/I / DSM 18386 / JCM 14125) TaxID=453591 RepID=A8AAY0_IGNH4|nr:amidophosphoribosyltransferase [Ignicoccus hospitalis KIN4/I]HIH91040.1 amidophosphoribosyltransferase [Desulfurococcaceae archaeon]